MEENYSYPILCLLDLFLEQLVSALGAAQSRRMRFPRSPKVLHWSLVTILSLHRPENPTVAFFFPMEMTTCLLNLKYIK